MPIAPYALVFAIGTTVFVAIPPAFTLLIAALALHPQPANSHD